MTQLVIVTPNQALEEPLVTAPEMMSAPMGVAEVEDRVGEEQEKRE